MGYFSYNAVNSPKLVAINVVYFVRSDPYKTVAWSNKMFSIELVAMLPSIVSRFYRIYQSLIEAKALGYKELRRAVAVLVLSSKPSFSNHAYFPFKPKLIFNYLK